jgi:hypothetical protein
VYVQKPDNAEQQHDYEYFQLYLLAGKQGLKKSDQDQGRDKQQNNSGKD